MDRGRHVVPRLRLGDAAATHALETTSERTRIERDFDAEAVRALKASASGFVRLGYARR